MDTHSNADLWAELQEARAESARKDAMISALLNQRSNCKGDETPPVSLTSSPPRDCTPRLQAEGPLEEPGFLVDESVEAVNKWFFSRGVSLTEVSVLLSEYCEFVRTILGIELDRLFIGAVMQHPKATAYVWKWEHGKEFKEHEIPQKLWRDVHEKLSSDEPFNMLRHGRATSVRMVASQKAFPPDCQWFPENGYQDYFALPMLRRGEFKGAIGWATKKDKGFSPAHIDFFHKSMPSFSFVMRQNVNEYILTNLTGRLEEEIKERTSELAEANRNLAQANRRITQQASAQLKHFAMMSHEIRTPLNGIIGLSSLLNETTSTSEQGELIGMLNASSNLLLRIVNDVLDYSKLVSGKFEMTLQPTHLPEVFKTVLCNVQAKATERKVQVRSNIAKDLPMYIETDGSRLQQIMYNLLGNAVKFSKQGDFVDFTVAVCAKEERLGDCLELTIKDYGKGIKKESFNLVFQPFFQAHTDEQFEYGGTGLGLAIVNKIVDSFGGTIAVDSKVGKFTEFIVRIPFVVSNRLNDTNDRPKKRVKTAPNKREETPPLIHHESRPDLMPLLVHKTRTPVVTAENFKILIAEDNLINQKLLCRILKRIGLRDVDVVENGEQAVKLARKRDFHLVFMDMHMPKMDGIEASRLIKQQCATSSETKIEPRIVFLTAHATDEFRQQAEEAGADEFIPKPYSIERIKELTASMCSHAESFPA